MKQLRARLGFWVIGKVKLKRKPWPMKVEKKARRQSKAADSLPHFLEGNWVLFVWLPRRGFVEAWFRTATSPLSTWQWGNNRTAAEHTYYDDDDPWWIHFVITCFYFVSLTNSVASTVVMNFSVKFATSRAAPDNEAGKCSPRYLLSRHDSDRHHTKSECRSVSAKNNLFRVSQKIISSFRSLSVAISLFTFAGSLSSAQRLFSVLFHSFTCGIELFFVPLCVLGWTLQISL